jgi:hypothetical protein
MSKLFVSYTSNAMHSNAGLWVEAALLLFTFFIIVPSIAAVIGYAVDNDLQTNGTLLDEEWAAEVGSHSGPDLVS